MPTRRAAAPKKNLNPLVMPQVNLVPEEPEQEEQEEGSGVVAPLFAGCSPPVLVDDMHPDPMKCIRLYRYTTRGPKRGQRTQIQLAQHNPMIIYNPTETEEADLLALLEYGEYMVEAINETGWIISARKLDKIDPQEEAVVAPAARAEAAPTLASDPIMQQILKSNAELQAQLVAMSQKAADAKITGAEGIFNAAQGAKPERDDVIETLRTQLKDVQDEARAAGRAFEKREDEERAAYRKTLETMGDAHRKALDDERDRYRRDIDLERTRYQTELTRLTTLADEARALHRTELHKQDKEAAEERRRLIDENTEIKRRLAKENEGDRERLQGKIDRLEEALAASRGMREKDVHELRKNELVLEKKIIAAGAKVRDEDDDEEPKDDGMFKKVVESMIDVVMTKMSEPAPQPVQQPAYQTQPAPQPVHVVQNPVPVQTAPERASQPAPVAAQESRPIPATRPAPVGEFVVERARQVDDVRASQMPDPPEDEEDGDEDEEDEDEIDEPGQAAEA